MKKWLSGIALLLCLLLLPPMAAVQADTIRYIYDYSSVCGVEPDDMGYTKNGLFYLDYYNVSQTELEDYLTTLNKVRFVTFDITAKVNKGQQVYYVYNTESDSSGYVVYSPTDQTVEIQVDSSVKFINESAAKKSLDTIDNFVPRLPSEKKGYILPQFFAITGTEASWSGQSQSAEEFDGQLCWEEMYDNVPARKIDTYLRFCYALGCDLQGDTILWDDDQNVEYEIINLVQDNQTLVILLYSPTHQFATVFYNPKLNDNQQFDLKTGSELITMFSDAASGTAETTATLSPAATPTVSPAPTDEPKPVATLKPTVTDKPTPTPKASLPITREGISAGYKHSVALRTDGTAIATGENGDHQCNVSNWSNLVAVSAGRCSTIGLRRDGTVVAAGDNVYGECEVDDWEDIVAISAGDFNTVGLRSDGTVVAVGLNDDCECEVDDWTHIVALSAYNTHTVGLRADGTVVATGDDSEGQCDVYDWADIQAVAAGDFHTVGLMGNGRVVAVGKNSKKQCDVGNWKNIVAISAGGYHTVGLMSDGTVVATGDNSQKQCNVSKWKNIVAISAGELFTLGLKADGTVVSTGYNKYGQCNVKKWADISTQ